MTQSKESGVTHEVMAYALRHQDDFYHYCEVIGCKPTTDKLYTWIYSNGQSEYSKNAITRAVKRLSVTDLLITPLPRTLKDLGIFKETSIGVYSEERSLYDRGMLGSLKQQEKESNSKLLLFTAFFVLGIILTIIFAIL